MIEPAQKNKSSLIIFALFHTDLHLRQKVSLFSWKTIYRLKDFILDIFAPYRKLLVC